ncbi:unnamed protein product [Dibothriocephalus latus]|uniref:Uncharacterized protein n=1 Tax=Dibothriocephalus latus TaxID=60516 RepID=A0A3P6VFR9_DIBLA|nr:unnamed protein product [Dibothriocephalus latus]
MGLESGCFVPEDSDEIAEIEARSESPSVDSSGAGDVRPILRELLSAAAQLPPPPSDSDLENAEEPGPSSDRPAPVTVEAALLSRKGSSRTGTWSSRRPSSSSLPGAERIGEAAETENNEKPYQLDSTPLSVASWGTVVVPYAYKWRVKSPIEFQDYPFSKTESYKA